MTVFSSSTLALDCSVKNITVCIIKDNEILTSFNEEEMSESQSKVLLPIIDQVVKDSSVKLADIEHVVFCHGPGSFTSLRVGLATLKGLFDESISYHSVSSLMCRSLSQKDNRSDAVISMGRDKVAKGNWKNDMFVEEIVTINGQEMTPSSINPEAFLKLSPQSLKKESLCTAQINYLLMPDFGK